MSEFIGVDDLHIYLAEVARAENEVQEIIRDNFLHSNFFHDAGGAMAELEYSQYFDLKEQFVREKKGKNFGERFAMAVSDEYVGKVKLVELGSTHHDGLSSDDLKAAYKNQRKWLIEHNVIEREMTREESHRMFAVRESTVEPPSGIDKRLIVSRIRPLIKAQMRTNEDTHVEFELFKQMVFSLPHQFYSIIRSRYGTTEDEWPEDMKQHVENLLHQFNDQDQPVVQNINTGYYLISNKVVE